MSDPVNLTAESEKRLAEAKARGAEAEIDYYSGLVAVLHDYERRVLAESRQP